MEFSNSISKTYIMKNSISKIVVAIVLLLSFTACEAQIQNAKTETVKIYGNCGMCENRIETAGNIKKIAKVDWNEDTKMATLTYDSQKTNSNEILKRIALSGHDSDSFLAPNDVYTNLPECCHYTRESKIDIQKDAIVENHNNHSENLEVEIQEMNPLKAVFENYFAVKDALVKTDGNSTSTKAKELISSINAVKMDHLNAKVHVVWMKVMQNLNTDAKIISETKDVQKQRDSFDTLSTNMYELIKVSKPESPVYYQHCPMANDGKGANWLSKENAVKNPYYGSMMLTCGKTIETIK